MAPRVFFITGTSTGFGAELVKVVLKNNDIAVATARDSSKLSFSGTNANNYLALDLDVTSQDSINKAFDAAFQKFGAINVLVNNAGYGLSGPFETLSEKQIRTQMEVNFFGLLDCTRKGLEIMREKNKPSGGVIQQVTSVGGQIGVPTFSIYCASKWAVEGFTETVQKELKPEWGIKLTNIEPGGFRTDWSGRSMTYGEIENKAYDHIDAQQRAKDRHGQQPGDPAKAAEAMYKLALEKEPPLRCILGTDGYKAINQKLEDYRQNVDKYKELSNSTDVDA